MTVTSVEIGLLGDRQHGRVAMAEALVRVLGARGLAEHVDVGWIDRTVPERRCFVPYVPFVEWQLADSRYRLVDIPSSAPYLTDCIGRPDAVVLVTGLPPEPAHSSLAVARLIAAPRVLVFPNGTTGDAQAAERQARELLTTYGWTAGTVSVVRMPAGDDSAEAAAASLLEAVHAHVPAPANGPDGAGSFLMQVEDVLDGMVAAGLVLRGEIGVGEQVEVIGQGERFVTTCAALRVPGTGRASRVTAGRDVGLTLGPTVAGRPRAGQVIAAPGTMTAQDRFRGWGHVLDDGRPGTGLRRGDRIGVRLYSADVAGEVTDVFPRPPFDVPAPDSPGLARAGDTVLVEITLAQPVAMAAGARFWIRASGYTVAVGTVSLADRPRPGSSRR